MDARTGEERWRVRISGRDGLTSPIVHDGALFYPANLGGLHAIGLRDGRERWRFRPAETQMWGVAAAGDVVVVGGWGPKGSRLFGIAPEDGRLLWSRDVEAFDYAELARDGSRVRLDTETGSAFVKPGTSRLVATERPPQPAYTYRRTHALRSRTRGWLYRPGWEASTSEPLEVDGLVLVNVILEPAKANGGLAVLDAETGRLRWRVEIPGDAEFRPAASRRLVYVTSTGSCAGAGGCRSGLYAIRR